MTKGYGCINVLAQRNKKCYLSSLGAGETIIAFSPFLYRSNALPNPFHVPEDTTNPPPVGIYSEGSQCPHFSNPTILGHSETTPYH